MITCSAAGNALLALAFTAAALAFALPILGAARLRLNQHGRARSLVRAGAFALLASELFTAACIALLAWCFLTGDTSIHAVVYYRSDSTAPLAWLFKLSGIWGGSEGSLLVWALMLGAFATGPAARLLGRSGRDVPAEARRRLCFLEDSFALGILSLMLAAFLGFGLLVPENQIFAPLDARYLDAEGNLTGAATLWGLSALLEHWAMAIHPPLLFVGYAGLAVPFAYAVAAYLADDRYGLWLRRSVAPALIAWLFLSLGIGTGGLWAYSVLGWGGYWGWDAVENASLLPWLASVAFLHSALLCLRQGSFYRWTLICGCLLFSLVGLDAFITRSGVIGSVHAFAGTEESFAFFLALTVAPLIAALVGSIARWRSFALAPKAQNRAEEGAGGKEALFYLNNLVMFGLLALIASMTLAPALPPWLPFAGRSFPAEAYLAVVAPVTVLYFLILCACLIVRWHGSAGQECKARARAVLLAGSPLFLLLCLYWAIALLPCTQHASSDSLASLMSPLYRHVLTLSAFFSAALTLGGVLCRSRELLLRSHPTATGLPSRAVPLRQIGALVVHASMAVLLIGLVGSTFYASDKTFSVTVDHQSGAALAETEPLALDGYRLDYQGMSTTVMANKTDLLNQVTFEVSRADGTVVGQATPSLQAVATTKQTHFHTAIMGSPLEDLFVIYKGTIPGSQTNDDVMELAIEVRINRLVSFVWAGFALFTIGCLLTLTGHLIPKKTTATDSGHLVSQFSNDTRNSHTA